MRKCPFCAEEIQAEAIKCKHCGERLDQAPAATQLGAAPLAPLAPAIPETSKAPMYEGSPSWRAYFGRYFLIVLLTPAVTAVSFWQATVHHGTTLQKALALAIPIALGVVIFFLTTLIRRSVKVRVTDRRIENEVGLFSRRIDILELWRVRDLQYRQSFLDRILGISHIIVFARDESTREQSQGGAAAEAHLGTLRLVGLPEGRRLFDQLRDSVSIQRQSNRVIGMTD